MPAKKAEGSAAKPAAKREDHGAPIEAYFAKQSEAIRALMEALRALILAEAPEAESGLKWGFPFFTLKGQLLCGLRANKAHLGLILTGPPGTFDDPEGLLSGEGETGRQLKLTPGQSIPEAQVRAWLQAAARAAAAKG